MISHPEPGAERHTSANQRRELGRLTNERAAAPGPAYHNSDLHNKQ